MSKETKGVFGGPATQFKKGVSGNPGGRRKLPEEVRIAKQMTQNELILIFNRLMFMTEAQIREHLQNAKTPIFERAICKVLNKADQYGDPGRLEFLLNRTIGKVTDRIEHRGMALTIIEKLDGSETHLAATLIEEKK